MRCKNELMVGGGPTSATSSMLPMSMPSSSVEELTQSATLASAKRASTSRRKLGSKLE